MSEPKIYEGPFDCEAWPERLPATVVDPRGERRIHGYCVRGDLANGHGIAAIAWLALRGELPTDAERDAFDTALAYLAPVHVGESGAHAALLARVVGARPSALVSVTATALAEQGRTERDSLAPWLAWLDAPTAEIPACAIERSPSEEASADQRELAARTAGWFGKTRALPATPTLTRIACAHALLHQLGFRDAYAIEAVAVWARLLVVVAESTTIRIGGFRQYPARLPDYQYVDDEGHSR
jgi:hypothetical protein